MRVFITGASEGIGFAIAQRLLKNGHKVWGTSRNPSFTIRHDHFHPVVMDLRYEASIEQAFALARNHAKGFDVLINNAGAAYYAPAKDINKEAIQEIMQVLFLGPLKLCRLAWSDLASNNGKLIHITSLATLLPIPYHAAYNAAKSAFSAYTRTLQIEAEEKQIAIVEVLPGDINTQFHHHACRATAAFEHASKHNPLSQSETMERVKQIIEKRLARAPMPERVARAVVRISEMSHPPERIYVGSFFQACLARRATGIFSAKTIHRWIRKYYGITHGLAVFLL